MTRKNIGLLLLILLSLPVFAQEDTLDSSYDPRGREKIRAAHAAYITERLELTSSEAEKFWPVYREYGEKRRAIRFQMREARRGETDGKTLIDLELKIKEQELEIEKEYATRLQQIISPEKFLKIRQAEMDFRKLLFRQIQHRQRRNR